ncbi:MAG: hypothetical protein JW809_00320 [Pirellulales bacterium]|nr:hypothetical protein [Pirellulales bacterium]
MCLATTLAETPPRAPVGGAGPSPAVDYYPGERSAIILAARRLFGRELSSEQWANLAGAPDGGEVEIGAYREGLYLELRDPATQGYHGAWRVSRRAGVVVLYLDALCVHWPRRRGQGLGLRIFARQVRAATDLGVGWIRTLAGRRKDENGYYTWPRFGFDSPLPGHVRRGLPAACQFARCVLDVMATQTGRVWWRERGVSLPLAFDLAPASRCQLALARYVLQRADATSAPTWTWEPATREAPSHA